MSLRVVVLACLIACNGRTPIYRYGSTSYLQLSEVPDAAALCHDKGPDRRIAIRKKWLNGTGLLLVAVSAAAIAASAYLLTREDIWDNKTTGFKIAFGGATGVAGVIVLTAGMWTDWEIPKVDRRCI